MDVIEACLSLRMEIGDHTSFIVMSVWNRSTGLYIKNKYNGVRGGAVICGQWVKRNNDQIRAAQNSIWGKTKGMKGKKKLSTKESKERKIIRVTQ